MLEGHTSPALQRIYVRDEVQGMVPHTFLRLLAEHLMAQGVDTIPLMPDDAMGRDAQQLGRYPAEDFCRLLLRAAEHLDDPSLGLHIGQLIRPRHLGALGYVLLACENLGGALLRIQRYHRLLHDINPVEYHVEGDAVVLQWGVARGRPGALFDEAGITAIVQFARVLGGVHLRPLAVDFVNPPPTLCKPFHDYFGCTVRWGQPVTRLAIPLISLHAPLQQPDPVLRRLMEEQVDTALDRLPVGVDLAEMTRRVVANLARHGMPQLEQVAAELRLSPRIFYRRLAAHGLNFRQLRESSLQQMAESYMRDARLSLADVSQLLGYTEQSAFTRAFKRWTGASPLQWRRAQQ